MKINAKLKAWLVDTSERAAATFGETFLAAFGIQGVYAMAGGDWSTLRGVAGSAAAAGAAAALTYLKGAIAAVKSGTVSPASFAPAQQPGQAEQDAPPAADAAGITTARELHLLPAAGSRKTGRRPKPPDLRDFKLTSYLRARLPKPPASINWARFVPGFPMLLNDRLGDCGEAGWLHILQTWLAAVGHLFTPNDAQALTLYEHVAGYRPGNASTDTGTVLRDLLKYVKANAVAGGHRIAAYVAVDPRNHLLVKQAIAEFGGLYSGVELTQAAYQDQGVHWKKIRGARGQPDPNLGHCIVYTGYDNHGLKTVTWGEEGTATWGWHDQCCVELWAVLSPDWMTAAGKNPDNVDWTQLQRDLTAL